MYGGLAKPIIRSNITDDSLAKARNIIENSERICVLTGAGISTDSGIPDFRGPNGLWTKNPGLEATADINSYLQNKSIRDRFWASGGFEGIGSSLRPNPGHKALVDLEKNHNLIGLITQNVDSLHQLAGNSEELVIEAHGNLRECICYSCAEIRPLQYGLDQFSSGNDPSCECGGILKANVVFFGEYLEETVINRAYMVAEDSDVMLVVGTSLRVPPVCDTVNRAYDTGSRIIIVNQQSTSKDHFASVNLRGSISEVLPSIIQ